MSIFGKLDAQTVSSNAFFIEEGEYLAEVTKAGYEVKQDGERLLVIKYTITDPDSQYIDSTATQRFTLVDPELTLEMLELMPAEEKKKIRLANAKVKRNLCGNPGNSSQKGLGVDVDDLNGGDWVPESLVGTKVKIGISNWGTDGVNVKWVNLQD